MVCTTLLKLPPDLLKGRFRAALSFLVVCIFDVWVWGTFRTWRDIRLELRTKDLEMVDVADFLAGVDVDQDFHRYV